MIESLSFMWCKAESGQRESGKERCICGADTLVHVKSLPAGVHLSSLPSPPYIKGKASVLRYKILNRPT